MEQALLERNVLGTMLQHQYLITDSLVKAEHFTSSVHRSIYQAMKRLVNSGQAVDVITLLTVANAEELGGLNYISTLVSYANEDKFDSYEILLIQLYQKHAMQNILNNALSDGWELATILSKLSELETHREQDLTTAYELAKSMMNMPFEEKAKRVGVRTGLTAYDQATGGLINGELTIIAARPSIGKTDLLINFALATQIHNNNTLALIFSLEMDSDSLGERCVCNLGRFDRNQLKNPFKEFSDGKKNEWTKMMGEFSRMAIHIHDKPNQSIAEMRSKIRKAVRENPEKQVVVFIDYLGLIKPNDTKASTYVQVSQISKDLKNIAREFEIPVCCLAQLNRSVEQRQDKRPMMSDLRDSGSIEQDSDIITLLYRDSYYNKEMLDDKVLELDIAKNRAGRTGLVKVEYNRFTGVIRNANH